MRKNKQMIRIFACLMALYLTISPILPATAEEATGETEITEAAETAEATDATDATEAVATEPVTAAETEPPDASASETDIPVVSADGITFRLFNYSDAINKDSTNAAWRTISSYFTFRNSFKEAGTDAAAYDIPSPNTNTAHDEDGFTIHHTTVERVLDGNGMPVLDLTRNADGTARTDPGLGAASRSLAYLFSNTGDHAVTAYAPRNTILRKDGTRYIYHSNVNAVDYDTSANLFRVRSYVERNSTTAGYGANYGDFLPFTYTGGTVAGTDEEGTEYHVLSTATDYWFGMTMEVDFFQTKDGLISGEEMVFNFSGDDDVWVFVDDVLVLDLGGTHGTVDGSINFATGQVLQYLSWNGANTTEEARTEGSSTSFPTTIRACFDAAGKIPNGGWAADGQSFTDYTKHTLKFFYMERGAAVANCLLDFRLPTLPDKSLTVTKELTAQDGAVTDFIQESLSYRFRVVKADSEGNSTGELFLAPGTEFDLMENGVKISTQTIDEDGYFSLKAGQSAQFTQMLEKGGGETAYIVEEILPDALTGQYAGVEYQVSGSGGETRTENGPAEGFTAFQTDILSAEETQTVTFRNKVDTTKLGSLRITKQVAKGSTFPDGQVFRIQVKLGDSLLAAGTQYLVGEETRTVSAPGILELKAGETALLVQGILSGTVYEITESDSQDGYCKATYSGTVTPEGNVTITEAGASGEFPLGGSIHVTVTNASYDFPAEIPLQKEAIDNNAAATFRFTVEQIAKDGDSWSAVNTLPGTTIATENAALTPGSIVIGYKGGTEGTFYYRISEQKTSENFLYDSTFYIVEITAEEGSASITGILRNGTEELSPDSTLIFVNRKITTLTVTKTVSGYDPGGKFDFTATVALNGEPFLIPNGEGYTVDGDIIRFSLGSGEQITLPHIPIGAEITVTEETHDGYSVTHQIDGIHNEPKNGSQALFVTDHSPIVLHFHNTSDYQLPLTGGSGTTPYTTGGLLCIMLSLLLYIIYAIKMIRKEGI